MNHRPRGAKREWKTVTDREAGGRNCEESKTCSEKSNGKSFKGLTVYPTTRSSPSSNSTSFSLISGLAPQGTEGTGSDNKEPESYTRLPVHTHTCTNTLQGCRTPKYTQTFCQTASKTIKEAESKAPWTLTLLSLFPHFPADVCLLFSSLCVSFCLASPSSSSQASQGMDRAGLCHLSLSAASPDLKGGTV